ncbi:MAG: UDP-N-acetylmuramate dehydrogenase [Alphaproteobacteria bacterium]|nr:UDP-N-acetylmuramate dehydrogenase [Alphaproteobacteria bacterium]
MNERLESFIVNSTSFKKNYKLSKINWFQVGGKADLLFKPKTEKELQEFLAQNFNLDILTLGVGSNIIIREGGYRGCIIKLGRAFTNIKQISATEIEVGCANLDQNIARFAADANIAGLEFLSGIPGSIGGAIKMNAGAYGAEFKDVVKKIYGYDKKGVLHELSKEQMNYTYRRSAPDKDLIYVKAILTGQEGRALEIKQKIKEIQENREASQPIRAKTGGSSFQNPLGKKAWQLIDQAGCRGLAIGDAIMSEKHCNFMINRGAATAKDLEDLGELVRIKVLAKTGITLDWEIKIIGEK